MILWSWSCPQFLRLYSQQPWSCLPPCQAGFWWCYCWTWHAIGRELQGFDFDHPTSLWQQLRSVRKYIICTRMYKSNSKKALAIQQKKRRQWRATYWQCHKNMPSRGIFALVIPTEAVSLWKWWWPCQRLNNQWSTQWKSCSQKRESHLSVRLGIF